MTDLETKLRRLSERGTPVGAGRLIERIEAELVGEPMVVVGGRRHEVPDATSHRPPPTRHPNRYRGPVLAVATFVAVLAAASLYIGLSRDSGEVANEPAPSTTAATQQPTTTLSAEAWPGPVAARDDLTVDRYREPFGEASIPDPLDVAVGWVDIQRVISNGQGWSLELVEIPPLAADLEPGDVIAYGLVFDADGDGVADYEVGIDNDAPEPGDFHVWVTDLATGKSKVQIGAPYGFPIQFRHPNEAPAPEFEWLEDRRNVMSFVFITGSLPVGLNREGVRLYAWAAASRDGKVFASDYAPDTGWVVFHKPGTGG